MTTDEAVKRQAAHEFLMQELVEALEELHGMYSYAWDLVDGGLMMFADSIPKFEAAHAKAAKALARAKEQQQ